MTDTTTGISLTANPMTITAGGSSKLTVIATNATTVTLTGSNGSSYPMTATGGTVSVSPTSTTTYTATAIGAAGPTGAASEMVKVTVTPANSSPVLTVDERRYRRRNSDQHSGGDQLPGNLHRQLPQGKSCRIDGDSRGGHHLCRMVRPVHGFGNVQPDSGGQYHGDADIRAGTAGITSLKHIIFFAQENRSLDNYFGAMREYWKENGFPDQSFDGLPQFNPTSGAGAAVWLHLQPSPDATPATLPRTIVSGIQVITGGLIPHDFGVQRKHQPLVERSPCGLEL